MNMSQDGNELDGKVASANTIRASKPYQPRAIPMIRWCAGRRVARVVRCPVQLYRSSGPYRHRAAAGFSRRYHFNSATVAHYRRSFRIVVRSRGYRWLAGAGSFIGFVLAFIITFWPRRRIDEIMNILPVWTVGRGVPHRHRGTGSIRLSLYACEAHHAQLSMVERYFISIRINNRDADKK